MMKNLLLLGLAFTASLGAVDAQKANQKVRPIGNVLETPALSNNANRNTTPNTNTKGKDGKNQKSMFSFGTQIGHTYYDLQTNSSSGNRVIRHGDGSISAAWNEVCALGTGPNYANRGAGYNYYNGTSWVHGTIGTCPDPFGAASKRIGWPELVALPNNKEMIFSHNSTAINVTSRPNRGTGGVSAWGPTTDLSFTADVNGAGNAGTWPRAVASGNYIHLIYALNNAASTATNPIPVVNGVALPMVYSRSSDGGATWDKTNVMLPGMQGVVASNPASFSSESFNNIGGDDYAIAVNGATVAIVTGSLGEPWTLWKSTDNGTNFTRRVIKTVLPADTVIITTSNGTDTAAYVNDAAHSVVVDNFGVVHVFAGMKLASIDVKTAPGGAKYYRSTGSSYTSNDYVNYGLLYWNDGMTAPVTSSFDLLIAGVEDSQPATSTTNWVGTGSATGAGQFPYAPGIVSMSSASVDPYSNIYVVYSAVVEGTGGGQTEQPFRDIYIMKRFHQYGAWSKPVYISSKIIGNVPNTSAAEQSFQESVYPSIARTVGPDNKVHIIFQADSEPGLSVNGDMDTEDENFIMYYAYDGGSFVGVKEDIANYVNTISAFPNPTTDNVTINVDLKKNANVSVRVTNIMGQEVANVAPKQMAAGKSQVKIDMNGLANGVYLYTVTSDNFTVTNRIVKQ
jgi:hypothetical protein